MRLPTDAPAITWLDIRQDQPHVITQTLTRGFAAFTTQVTLGSTTPTTPPAAPPVEITPEPDATSTKHELTTAQIGAIVGSIAAVILIIIVAGICLSNSRKRARPEEVYDYSSYSSPSTVDDIPRTRSKKYPRRPPPVAELVPGGPKYPTYRALPISNPWRSPPVRHTR